MEVLTDVLKGLRAEGSVYFCDVLEPPWKLHFDGEGQASFHYLRRGRCRVEAQGQEESMAAGDLVFTAPGVAHQLRSDPVDDLERVVPLPSVLLCGYCRFGAAVQDPLMAALPEFVLLRQETLVRRPWLSRTLEHLGAEYRSQDPGSELTVNKLTEVLLVELIRVDFGQQRKQGLVAALQDPAMTRALTHLHESPGEHWTLQSLARTAAVSRSALARKFRETLDMPMFEYLTRLRMRNARELLTTTRLPVTEVAERVGYQSDVAFVKAFRKFHGVTPRGHRQRQAPT